MNQLIPLAMVSSGEMVQVVDVRAGFGLQRRLADMGLTPGVTIRVLNSQMSGPIVINLRGSRLVLGHGVAQKILVKKV
ncbi:MAG: ferrous iron transport protein A [Dehalococcoidia bacterium]|nr:ferrous iron transport protein A [Dehalococcoidia bacterium]